jgi:hypothetical protein
VVRISWMLACERFTDYRNSAVGEGVVILKAGPDQSQFHIHKALLVHHSEYFRKALNGLWKDAEEGVIKIEDVEPEVGKLTNLIELITTGKSMAN